MMRRKEFVTVLFLLVNVVVGVVTLLMGDKFWTDAPRMNVSMTIYQGWLMVTAFLVVMGFALIFWFLLSKEGKDVEKHPSDSVERRQGVAEPAFHGCEVQDDVAKHRAIFEREMERARREALPKAPVVTPIPIIVEHQRPTVMTVEELRTMRLDEETPVQGRKEQVDYTEDDNPYRED